MRGLISVGVCVVVGFGWAEVAWGQGQSYGEVASDLDLVTVGDPGNRGTVAGEVIPWGWTGLGAVDREYRMMRTEVTVGMWKEFVEAYLPYRDDPTGLQPSYFTGEALIAFNGGVSVRNGFELDDPADMSWEFAARYVNWLHNGKAPEQSAFQSGAYDTSTFTENPDGSGNHQRERSPGARFWLPSIHEISKAAFWDPQKDGVGGYWQFPNGTDEDLLPGLPAQGGQRNAGPASEGFPLPVGSYPDEASPWGLLDVAGGQLEWTEDGGGSFNKNRWAIGSKYKNVRYNDQPINQTHRLGNPTIHNSVDSTRYGLRIATLVPAPSAGIVVAVGALFFSTRRRETL